MNYIVPVPSTVAGIVYEYAYSDFVEAAVDETIFNYYNGNVHSNAKGFTVGSVFEEFSDSIIAKITVKVNDFRSLGYINFPMNIAQTFKKEASREASFLLCQNYSFRPRGGHRNHATKTYTQVFLSRVLIPYGETPEKLVANEKGLRDDYLVPSYAVEIASNKCIKWYVSMGEIRSSFVDKHGPIESRRQLDKGFQPENATVLFTLREFNARKPKDDKKDNSTKVESSSTE